MTEKEMTENLMNLLETLAWWMEEATAAAEIDEDVKWLEDALPESFESYGMLTNSNGFVLTLKDSETFEITVKKR